MIVGAGLSNGADVLDQDGTPILRIQTSHPVENIAFAGDDFKTLYLSGIGGITKVQMNFAGPDPNKSFH